MINVNNLNTLFRYLLRFMLSGPLKFKGCFALKYFSPRHHYILNLPNCSISNDFFCGSSTFSIYGSLVHKIYNFLWPQEFWEIPKGCLFFVKIPQITQHAYSYYGCECGGLDTVSCLRAHESVQIERRTEVDERASSATTWCTPPCPMVLVLRRGLPGAQRQRCELVRRWDYWRLPSEKHAYDKWWQCISRMQQNGWVEECEA